MDELEGRVDLVIPVTHLGLKDDTRLATAYDMPLIVGGHSHTRLENGVIVEGTRIVQTGAKAQYLGRVDLWIDRPSMEVLKLEAKLLPLEEDIPVEASFAARSDELEGRAEAEMGEVVGTLANALGRTGGRIRSSTSGNLITDLFRQRAGVPIGFHNKGGTRTNLPAGEITRRNLFELLPFDNTLVVIELTGAELIESVRRGVEDGSHSGIEVSGIVVRTTAVDVPVGKLVAIELDGKPIDPAATYRVATNSFLAHGGDEYFPEDAKIVVDTGFMLRDLLEDALREHGTLHAPEENRFMAE